MQFCFHVVNGFRIFIISFILEFIKTFPCLFLKRIKYFCFKISIFWYKIHSLYHNFFQEISAFHVHYCFQCFIYSLSYLSENFIRISHIVHAFLSRVCQESIFFLYTNFLDTIKFLSFKLNLKMWT